MKTTKTKGKKTKQPSSIVKRTVIAAIILLAVLAGFLFWRFNEPVGAKETLRVSQTLAAKLKGNWLRQDGGYVIEIRSMSSDGKLDAAYFNPNPIHAYRAEATQEGTTLKLLTRQLNNRSSM